MHTSSPRRRHILAGLAGLAALHAAPARAQAYPAKPIRLIVPYGSGGPTDTAARLVGERMGETLRQSVVVDNRAGAGGNIGTGLAAASPADGYTLLMGTNNTLAANISVFKKLPFDPVKDFAPIGMIFYSPSMLAVHPSVAAKDVAELIALLKRKPEGYSFASGSVGASSHFAGELMNTLLGVRMQHVPYKSDAAAVTDAIGGQVPIVFCNIATGTKFARTGQLRALGVTSARRAPAFPDLPAIAESLPGFDISAWFSLMAPSGTPPEIVGLLNTALNKALQDATVRERLAAMGGIAAPSTPEEVSSLLLAEIPKWGKLAKQANIQLD